MAVRNITAAVRARHLRALRSYQYNLPLAWRRLPLATAAVQYFEKLAMDRNWRDTTKMREMANFTGAMTNLPYYCNAPTGVNLNDDVVWKNAMGCAQKDQRRDECRKQPAADPNEVDEALRLCDDKVVKMALMFSWLFAGRVGDVLQLETQNIKFDRSACRLDATFYRGKGVEFSQPYTLSTSVPDDWAESLVDYRNEALKRQSKTTCFFPKTVQNLGALVTEALRVVNADLGARAIRRGALQSMAKGGIPIETLRKFAGHKRDSTTRRYLGWDEHIEAEHAEGREAARFLAPRRPAGSDSA